MPWLSPEGFFTKCAWEALTETCADLTFNFITPIIYRLGVARVKLCAQASAVQPHPTSKKKDRKTKNKKTLTYIRFWVRLLRFVQSRKFKTRQSKTRKYNEIYKGNVSVKSTSTHGKPKVKSLKPYLDMWLGQLNLHTHTHAHTHTQGVSPEGCTWTLG